MIIHKRYDNPRHDNPQKKHFLWIIMMQWYVVQLEEVLFFVSTGVIVVNAVQTF